MGHIFFSNLAQFCTWFLSVRLCHATCPCRHLSNLAAYTKWQMNLHQNAVALIRLTDFDVNKIYRKLFLHFVYKPTILTCILLRAFSAVFLCDLSRTQKQLMQPWYDYTVGRIMKHLKKNKWTEVNSWWLHCRPQRVMWLHFGNMIKHLVPSKHLAIVISMSCIHKDFVFSQYTFCSFLCGFSQSELSHSHYRNFHWGPFSQLERKASKDDVWITKALQTVLTLTGPSELLTEMISECTRLHILRHWGQFFFTGKTDSLYLTYTHCKTSALKLKANRCKN